LFDIQNYIITENNLSLHRVTSTKDSSDKTSHFNDSHLRLSPQNAWFTLVSYPSFCHTWLNPDVCNWLGHAPLHKCALQVCLALTLPVASRHTCITCHLHYVTWPP